MRLARTIWNQLRAEQISQWLQTRGVQIELQPYPIEEPSSWRIWVLEEDQLQAARDWIDSIENGTLDIGKVIEELPKDPPLSFEHPSNNKRRAKNRAGNLWLTRSLMLLLVFIHCALHLGLNTQQAIQIENLLLIDQPTTDFRKIPSSPKPWPGLYQLSLEALNSSKTTDMNSDSSLTARTQEEVKPAIKWQFLSKVKEGQLWRLFTPILLHGDWLHLLFNLIWLSFLGIAIEPILGKSRLAGLILMSALLSNLAEYLIGGYLFLGFSGVIMAMVGFTYIRTRYFPWEGYPIAPATFTFIGFYLILTLSLQALSFILEALTIQSVSLGIANGAHLSGLVVGMLLARLRLMAARQSP